MGVQVHSPGKFLRDLYPDTQFPTKINARIFDINNKFVSPERGSPARFVNAIGKPDLVTRFMPPGGTVTSGLLMSDFMDAAPNTIDRPDELDGSSLATVSGQFVTNQDYYGSNSKFNWKSKSSIYRLSSLFSRCPFWHSFNNSSCFTI